jgi:hypothetical protein
MRFWLLACLVIVLAGCAPFASLPGDPPRTPQAWLDSQPTAQIGSLMIVQPSTSLIVYLLGLLACGAGIYYLHIRRGQRARVWWGAALLLWGAGALLAGTSYEAFSYYLKCAGRAVCAWTTWYEILYLVLSVASVDAMLVAVAYSSATGRLRRHLITYASANLALYTALVLVGVWVPARFLISFEFLILAAAPTIVLFLWLNGTRYAREKYPLDRALLGVWAGLIATIAAYFAYSLSGLTGRLWARGAWFSDNDVLHIGLILWMLYIVLFLAPRVMDAETSDNSALGGTLAAGTGPAESLPARPGR